jgi:hypothetical protein
VWNGRQGDAKQGQHHHGPLTARDTSPRADQDNRLHVSSSCANTRWMLYLLSAHEVPRLRCHPAPLDRQISMRDTALFSITYCNIGCVGTAVSTWSANATTVIVHVNRCLFM